MGNRSLDIHLNQLWVIFLPWVHSHLRMGGPTYCQHMRFKICGRSRSNLKMSNNKHLLLQRPFLININYHKIPLRIFLGDIKNINYVFPKKKVDPHIVPHMVKICGGKCVVGSHQPSLININYHKIPLRIFLGADPHIVNICGSKYAVDLDLTLKCQIISIYYSSGPS